MLSKYEKEQYETGKYRKELKELVAKKYIADQFLNNYRENQNT